MRGGMIAAAPWAPWAAMAAMALAGIEGTIGGDAGDLLIGRDLVQKFRQHGGITHVADGELRGPDLQGLLVSSDVNLAPDAALRAAMLAGSPLAFALNLDAGAVDQEVQRPLRSTIGDVDLQRLLAAAERAEVGHRPLQADQPQEALDEPSSPWSPGPVAFAWIDLPERDAEQHLHRAAGLNGRVVMKTIPRIVFRSCSPPGSGCRPRLPVGAASQIMVGSNQIVSAPRRLSASLRGRPVPGLVGRG